MMPIAQARQTLAVGLLAVLLCLGLCGAALAVDLSPVVKVSQSGEAFVLELHQDIPVTQKTAWEVLTDFDHMAAFASNLVQSRISGRQGNTMVVYQEGVAKFGFLSFKFVTERELHLEPMQRILSRTVRGSVKRGSSDMRLSSGQGGRTTHLHYRAEFVPDSMLARFFGESFVQRETTEQFRLLAEEMVRRESRVAGTEHAH